MTFKTVINTIEVNCMKVIVEDKKSRLWHIRFVHLKFRSLNPLVSQSIGLGFPRIKMPNKMCDGFLVCKQPTK